MPILPQQIARDKTRNNHNSAINHRRHYYSTKVLNNDNSLLSNAADQPNELNSLNLKQLNKLQCYQLCIFPFVRAEILDHGQQTFRAKEFCDTVQELQRFILQNHEQPRQQRLRSTYRNDNDNNLPSIASRSKIISFTIITIISTISFYTFNNF